MHTATGKTPFREWLVPVDINVSLAQCLCLQGPLFALIEPDLTRFVAVVSTPRPYTCSSWAPALGSTAKSVPLITAHLAFSDPKHGHVSWCTAYPAPRRVIRAIDRNPGTSPI